MGYTVQTDAKRTITWDDNPYANQSYAVLTDDVVTEFVVQDANGVSCIYTLDQAMLTHLQTVITQLLAEIAAP